MPLIRPKKRWFQIGFKQIKKIVPKGVNINNTPQKENSFIKFG